MAKTAMDSEPKDHCPTLGTSQTFAFSFLDHAWFIMKWAIQYGKLQALKLLLHFTFWVDSCAVLHLFFSYTYLQNFSFLISDPASLFSSFHTVKDPSVSFLTTHKNHGGGHYFSKENCTRLIHYLFIIFFNLKLWPSVLLEALWIPATNRTFSLW